jgi:glycine/D-amino acid oxidase-like deaminating enzyme
MASHDAAIFAADFKAAPYWWDAAPREPTGPASLPAEVDVAIVGSGHTGLSAALTLARAGRSVAVLDRGPPGFGASSRNAGFVGRTFKHSFASLVERAGLAHALAIYRELQAAFDFLLRMIENEAIDCGLRRCGRLIVANAPHHYDEIAASLALKQRHLGEAFEMVSRAELHREIESDLYCGGAVIPDLCSLHPGLYHQGLLARVREAGASVHGGVEVRRIGRGADVFSLSTASGEIRAGHVVVATNGYSGPALPAIRRRVIPFRGFMIATEALPAERIERILPRWRTTHDWHHDIDFLRRSPDGRRLLFGGLTGTPSDDLPSMARALRARLLRILPQLAEVRISHAWNGYCAGTFDLYPHLGVIDGVHYALGYCFAGLPAGTYFGHKTALAILGSPEARTVFDGRPLEGRWFYRGTPWFVPPVMAHWRRQDRREDRRYR